MSLTPAPVRRGRLRRPVGLAVALAATVLLTAGCTAREAYEKTFSLGFPQPATKEAEKIYELWLGSVAAATVVGLFVSALIMWAVFRYRRRSDELPAQIRYNLPVEVLYTVVPFVIIAVLFYYTAITQNFVNQLTPEKEGGADVNIGVVGFQWNWTFVYDDEDVQTTGDQRRPAVLVLPTETKIRFTETSPDVIHSFYVPAFLFKRDVIPGRANTFEIEITKEGEYIGRCAELCGEKHSAMNFLVRAVPMAEYEQYVAQLKQDPTNRTSETGQGAVVLKSESTEGDVS